MRIAREEIFGPVICLLPYGDEAEALRLANDSDFGLSGSVWTADVEHGIDFARGVRTGTFNVNTFSLDMLGPFGGYKNSGLGREFGPEGFGEYLEHKMIHLLGRLRRRRVMGDRWNVEVDRSVCIGSGMCVDHAPDGFRLDSARQSHAREPESDAGERLLAAAEGCPVEAIMITLADGGEPVFPPEE